jgi:hypothetical protein
MGDSTTRAFVGLLSGFEQRPQRLATVAWNQADAHVIPEQLRGLEDAFEFQVGGLFDLRDPSVVHAHLAGQAGLPILRVRWACLSSSPMVA